MKKDTNERSMSSRQKVVQMQHYWNDLSHTATDDMKKKSMKMRFGITNIKLDKKGGKLVSFDEADKKMEEAKQGHALVVGGKIAARGSKRELMKKVKKDKIKLDPKGDQNFLNVFISYLPLLLLSIDNNSNTLLSIWGRDLNNCVLHENSFFLQDHLV